MAYFTTLKRNWVRLWGGFYLLLGFLIHPHLDVFWFLSFIHPIFSMSSFLVVVKVFLIWLSCYLFFLALLRRGLGFLLTKSKLTTKCVKLILVDLLFRFHLLIKIKFITQAYSFYSYYAYDSFTCQLIIRDLSIELFYYLNPNFLREKSR